MTAHTPPTTPRPRRSGGERGQVAGIEVLPFGLLVFVAGTLLITNIWAVVDAKFATDAAAREAARWVVERAGTDSATPEALHIGAEELAGRTLADHGRSGGATVTVGPPGATFQRCERITVTVAVQVPALRIPFVGGFGDGFDVVATHSELVDPTRTGLGGRASCIR